jgi:20S proteasome alpha/beta subunit
MKNNKAYLPIRTRKDMTLIIGAKCKDGVVLIADKRIVEGTDIAVGEKISLLPLGIVVAGAGVGEVIDKFNERIPAVLEQRRILNYQAMKKENPDANLEDAPFYFRAYEFLEDCEGLLFELNEKYKRSIQILVGSGNVEESDLNYIDSEGFLSSKRRTYISIGSGSPYANLMLKKLWSKDLSMLEMAKIGKFIINYVAETNVDTYVGDGIQIVVLPNLPKEQKEGGNYQPHEIDLSDFDDKRLRNKFNSFFADIQNKIKNKQTTFSSL